MSSEIKNINVEFIYPIRYISLTYSKLPNSPEASGKLIVGDLAVVLILTGDSDW